MPKAICTSVLAGALASSLLIAQQGKIAGPVSGYVFDRGAHALRPVLGIAGASLLGEPLTFGVTPAAVAVSPRQDYAIVTADDRSLHLFRINGGTVSEIPLNGLAGLSEGVAFSPSGTAAALYANGHVQVLTGLPDSPVAGPAIDARAGQDSSALSVRPHPHRLMATEMFAVSDDGALVLAASDNSVRLIQASGGATNLLEGAAGAFVAFAPGSHNAAVAHPGGLGLVLVQDAGGTTRQQTLAQASDIASANGVAFSSDGMKLYVARSTGSVSAFDVKTGNRTDIACDCVPFGLTPMGSLFRLNELGSGPLWLFDPAGSRIVFVPAKSN